MDCKEFNRLISRYMDDETMETERVQLESHMNECEQCRKTYEDLREVHKHLSELFNEKVVIPGLENMIISKLPEKKSIFSFRVSFLMKKVLVFLIPLLILISVGVYSTREFLSKVSHTKVSLPAIVTYGSKTYGVSGADVITDEKIIDKEIGTIKYRLDGSGKIGTVNEWASTIAEPGTKVYSVKGFNSDEAIAIKTNGRWMLCNIMGTQRQPYSIFTEDMLTAEKIVVSTYDQNNGKEIDKEITDKDIIKKVSLILKDLSQVQDPPNIYSFSSAKDYSFYFVIRDSNGIGKLGPKYQLTLQDVNLDGYIFLHRSYRATPELSRLITSPFGNPPSFYNERLGGKQQIYKFDNYAPKLIFRKLIKETVDSKFETRLLNEGDKLWQNGSQVQDDLKGKYKVEVIMKNTTIQQGVIDELKNNLSKIPGAVSIAFTNDSSPDTTVLYIGFDEKPDFRTDESGDTFLLLIPQEKSK